MSFQPIVKCVRKSIVVFVTAACIAVGLGLTSFAQEGNFDRKVKTKVPPAYPEIARKLGLSGTVKLELVVAPNGNVKDTKVIGGHPILVSAAVDAVKKWKFETASGDSTGTVEFRFDPGN